MARKRILVTGASGFIGRWSVPPLVAAGHEVHAVVHAIPADSAAQLRGAEVHGADLLDGAAVEALMREVEPSHLLHFAWIATPGVYWHSPENWRWLAAGQSLLRSFHAVGGSRAVMAGSCAEYDWSRVGICDERTGPLADDRDANLPLYAKCKVEMQRALAEFGATQRLSTAWGRIFFQYGPGEHPDRLVASVITHLLAGREAKCSHGRQIRSFLHVSDVGGAFAALLESEVEGAVNVGGGDAITVRELLDEVATQVGRPELLRFGARSVPAGEPATLLPAMGRLRDELHWRPRFTLCDGIADTVSWWREALMSERPR